MSFLSETVKKLNIVYDAKPGTNPFYFRWKLLFCLVVKHLKFFQLAFLPHCLCWALEGPWSFPTHENIPAVPRWEPSLSRSPKPRCFQGEGRGKNCSACPQTVNVPLRVMCKGTVAILRFINLTGSRSSSHHR